MKSIDKWVALALVLICGTMALSAQDARRFHYPEWQTMSYGEQLATASMSVLAAAYALEYVEWKHPELKGIRSWLPYYMRNQEQVKLVELVYAHERYRNVPYVEIMLRPDIWYAELGIKNLR